LQGWWNSTQSRVDMQGSATRLLGLRRPWVRVPDTQMARLRYNN